MDDLISRQAAIANMNKVIMFRTNPEWKDRVAAYLKSLPSAQQWIPCSERLPEKTGNYLVTKVDNITNEQEMDIAYYADWLKQIVGNNGFHKHAKVVAWCPLPEPYKGENNATLN